MKPHNTISFLSSTDHRNITSPQDDQPIIIGRASNLKNLPSNHSSQPSKTNMIFNSPVMSKTHAQLNWSRQLVYVQDTGSTHGTWIKEPGSTFHRLTPHQPTKLENGMIIRFGKVIATGPANDRERHYPVELTVKLSKVLSTSQSGTYGLTPDELLTSSDEGSQPDQDAHDLDQDGLPVEPNDDDQQGFPIGSYQELMLRRQYLSHDHPDCDEHGPDDEDVDDEDERSEADDDQEDDGGDDNLPEDQEAKEQEDDGAGHILPDDEEEDEEDQDDEEDHILSDDSEEEEEEDQEDDGGDHIQPDTFSPHSLPEVSIDESDDSIAEEDPGSIEIDPKDPSIPTPQDLEIPTHHADHSSEHESGSKPKARVDESARVTVDVDSDLDHDRSSTGPDSDDKPRMLTETEVHEIKQRIADLRGTEPHPTGDLNHNLGRSIPLVSSVPSSPRKVRANGKLGRDVLTITPLGPETVIGREAGETNSIVDLTETPPAEPTRRHPNRAIRTARATTHSKISTGIQTETDPTVKIHKRMREEEREEEETSTKVNEDRSVEPMEGRPVIKRRKLMTLIPSVKSLGIFALGGVATVAGILAFETAP